MRLQKIFSLSIIVASLVGAQEPSAFNAGGVAPQKTQSEIIDEKLPQYLQENNKNIDEKLDKILEINQEQTRKIEQLEDSNIDMLRREIKKIYGKYRAFKKISQYDKIDCAKLVEDYRAENGNTYVEDLWAEIRTWEVVDSEDEIIDNKCHLK